MYDVAGRIIEINAPPTWLARIQVVEYLRAFYLGRVGWSRLKALIMISGAFGVFRRDVVVEVGGLDHRASARTSSSSCGSIGTCNDGARLRSPIRRRTGLLDGGAQRTRGAPPSAGAVAPRALGDAVGHRSMLLNPRYGRVGMLAVPYYWFFELIAPVIELAGLALMLAGLVFGVIDIPFAIMFLLVAYGYGMLVTLASMAIEELSFHRYPRWRDLAVSALAAVLENVGYRQATAWWRIARLVGQPHPAQAGVGHDDTGGVHRRDGRHRVGRRVTGSPTARLLTSSG